MTVTPINCDLVHLDEETSGYFSDFVEGVQVALDWLKTHPTREEAQKIADLHMEIRAGGDGDFSSYWHNADLFPTFVPFMEKDGSLQVIDGPAHSAAMKADPEVGYPYEIPWVRAWHFHSENAFWQGTIQAVYTAINL